MQGDEITATPVDMGTHRGVVSWVGGREESRAEARGHRGCFVRGSGSGYACEVDLAPLSLGLG